MGTMNRNLWIVNKSRRRKGKTLARYLTLVLGLRSVRWTKGDMWVKCGSKSREEGVAYGKMSRTYGKDREAVSVSA